MLSDTYIKKLLKAARNKNKSAEKELYTICYQRCFKIARLYSRDIEEATSIFNYAMMDVFDQLNAISSYKHLLKLTSKIVKRDCIDKQRKNAVYLNKLSVVAERDSKKSIVNDALSQLRMEEIFLVISQLDTNQRLCFNLHAIEGYKYKEIAERLNININTAKWYVAEAKKSLQLSLRNNSPHLNKKNHHGS